MQSFFSSPKIMPLISWKAKANAFFFLIFYFLCILILVIYHLVLWLRAHCVRIVMPIKICKMMYALLWLLLLFFFSIEMNLFDGGCSLIRTVQLLTLVALLAELQTGSKMGSSLSMVWSIPCPSISPRTAFMVRNIGFVLSPVTRLCYLCLYILLDLFLNLQNQPFQ